MQRNALLNLASIRTTPFLLRAPPPLRTYASKRGSPQYSDEDLSAARKWLSELNPDTIPHSLCEITFSRSSGPGGQNVNKCVPLKPSLPPKTKGTSC